MPDFNFTALQEDCRNFNFKFDGTFLAEGIFAALVPVTPTFVGQQGNQGTLQAPMDIPIAEMSGVWDVDVWRGHRTVPVTGFEDGTPKYKKLCGSWRVPHTSTKIKVCENWQDGKKTRNYLRDIYEQLNPKWLGRCGSFEDAKEKHKKTTGSADSGTPTRLFHCFSFSETFGRHARVVEHFVECWPRRKFECFSYQPTERKSFWIGDRFSLACDPFSKSSCSLWGRTGLPELIWPIPIPPEEPEPEPGPGEPGYKFHGDPNFDLRCLLPTPIWAPIRFNLGIADVCGQATNLIIIPRVYILTHALYIKLISDGTVIKCPSISLSIDRDSWGWSWSATLPERRDELIDTQQDVEIGIDGNVWKGKIEGYQGNYQFGQTRYSINGRSLAAELTLPYTAKRSRTETGSSSFKQLAEDEVYATGWSLVWHSGITDWTVPGGLFTYSDFTPMEALTCLADTIGAVVQAHKQNAQLLINPKYEVAPWDLAAASVDAVLPPSAILQESIRWVPRSLMKGIWVSGQTQGIRVRVYRTGTDGNPYASMVVNPLITDVQAGIQKGVQVLSATGKRRNIDLTMPLLPTIGVLSPGDLVEVDSSPSWRGYVDAVKIEASFVNGVKQILSIEHIQEF